MTLTTRGQGFVRVVALLAVGAMLASGLALAFAGGSSEPAAPAPRSLQIPAATGVPTPAPTPPAATVVAPTPSPAAPSPATSPPVEPAPAESSAPAVVAQGEGTLTTVAGRSEVSGTGGRLVRYRVRVEDGTGQDGAAFAAAVERILGDPRGWGADGRLRFQRVDSGADLSVVLASPRTTDVLCAPLRTGGIFSCHADRHGAVINLRRWTEGASSYAGDLARYREYVVSHEVGHALGHGHVTSCLPGGRAQTMQQQTKGLAGCSRNPWPYPDAA